MGLLSRDDIAQLHQAALALGLADRRAALLAGFPPTMLAALPRATIPAEQLLQDLSAFNLTQEYVDGQLPECRRNGCPGQAGIRTPRRSSALHSPRIMSATPPGAYAIGTSRSAQITQRSPRHV